MAAEVVHVLEDAAETIVGVGTRRIELDHLPEALNRGLEVALFFEREPKIPVGGGILRIELDFPPKELLSLRKRVSVEWKSPMREEIEKVIEGFTFSMVVAHCGSSSIALRKLCSSCGMREGGGVEKLRPSYFATEGIERETDESKSLEFGSVALREMCSSYTIV
jgi:hypothetical protein